MKIDKASVRDRQIKALQMRSAGKTYDEIAKELEYKDWKSVHKLVTKALKEVVRENATDLITMTALQYETFMDAWVDRAMKDEKVLKVYLELMRERNKLLNLVVEKQEITHKVETIYLDWENNRLKDDDGLQD